MNIIWNSWKNSLEVFHKDQFFRFFLVAFKNFCRGLVIALSKFWWLIIAHAAVIFYMKVFFSKAPFVEFQNLIKSDQLLIILLFTLFFTVSFFLSSIFIILIMKSCLPMDFSFKDSLVRYFQLMLYFFLLSFIFLGFFKWLLLSKAFRPNLFLNAFLTFLNLMIVFYWFESSFSVRDFFKSIELALNFIFYNLPFIFILLFLYISSDVFMNFIIYKGFTSIDGIQVYYKLLNFINIKNYSLLALNKLFHFFLFIVAYLFFINKKDDLNYRSFFDSVEEEIE